VAAAPSPTEERRYVIRGRAVPVDLCLSVLAILGVSNHAFDGDLLFFHEQGVTSLAFARHLPCLSSCRGLPELREGSEVLFTQHDSERGGEKKRAFRVEVYPKVREPTDNRQHLDAQKETCVGAPQHDCCYFDLKMEVRPDLNRVHLELDRFPRPIYSC